MRVASAQSLTDLRSQVLNLEGIAIGYSQLLQRLGIIVKDLLVAGGEPLPVGIELMYPCELVSAVG